MVTSVTRRITIAGRRVLIISPENPTGDVLFWLHGLSQSGAVIRRFSGNALDTLAEAGLTVVYPDGISRHWNDGLVLHSATDDVGYLCDLADELSPKRLFAGGFSNGGYMTHRLLSDQPKLLSGAVTVAANLPQTPKRPKYWAPTPLLFIHGDADPIVSYSGFAQRVQTFAKWNGCTPPRTTIMPNVTINRFPGKAPVEAWTLHNTGHVVPSPAGISSDSLGPGCSNVNIAEIIANFFGFNATV